MNAHGACVCTHIHSQCGDEAGLYQRISEETTEVTCFNLLALHLTGRNLLLTSSKFSFSTLRISQVSPVIHSYWAVTRWLAWVESFPSSPQTWGPDITLTRVCYFFTALLEAWFWGFERNRYTIQLTPPSNWLLNTLYSVISKESRDVRSSYLFTYLHMDKLQVSTCGFLSESDKALWIRAWRCRFPSETYHQLAWWQQVNRLTVFGLSFLTCKTQSLYWVIPRVSGSQ